MTRLNSFRQRHGAVISRIVAAALGGYLLTNSLAVLIAFLMPLHRAHSVAFMMLGSFALYTLIILRVFSVASAKRAWLEIMSLLLLSLLGNTAFHMLGAAS